MQLVSLPFLINSFHSNACNVFFVLVALTWTKHMMLLSTSWTWCVDEKPLEKSLLSESKVLLLQRISYETSPLSTNSWSFEPNNLNFSRGILVHFLGYKKPPNSEEKELIFQEMSVVVLPIVLSFFSVVDWTFLFVSYLSQPKDGREREKTLLSKSRKEESIQDHKDKVLWP